MRHILVTVFFMAVSSQLSLAADGESAEQVGAASVCAGLDDSYEVNGVTRRTVCSDVAALDHILVYNRFGSFNPYGMIFALRRDLVAADAPPTALDASYCREDDGTDKALAPDLEAGAVRLKDCRRPRPLVLRANEGDLLAVRVTNLLREERPGVSETFCRDGALPGDGMARDLRDAVSQGPEDRVRHGEALCRDTSVGQDPEAAEPGDTDWPRTRLLNFAVQGLVAVRDPAAQTEVETARAERELRVCRGLTAIAPGQSVMCFYEVDRVGPYFFASNAAPSGGEGDGGSITHGLFGAVVVHEPETAWYRSQVSATALDAAWTPAEPSLEARLGDGDHRRDGVIDYEATGPNGYPVLDMQ